MNDQGNVITVRGLVEPEKLGQVMMHEHLHANVFDWENNRLITVEDGVKPSHRDLVFREGIPNIRKCNEYGCHAYVDVSPPPWRGCPEFYVEASDVADIHIILSTGAYREMELGTYWAQNSEDTIWPYLRIASMEELEDYFTREITEGINGTNIRAGAIKLASSAADFTSTEAKCFRAGARAQKKTGVHITTHCTVKPAAFEQLLLLDEEGVDLNRVIIGHIGWALGEKEFRKACIPWMKNGATFLMTGMQIGSDEGECYRDLIEGIHDLFDAGVGNHICFGLDCAFISQFGPMKYDNTPKPPWLYMFTQTLPLFRILGLTAEEEDCIMRKTPQRILPVQKNSLGKSY